MSHPHDPSSPPVDEQTLIRLLASLNAPAEESDLELFQARIRVRLARLEVAQRRPAWWRRVLRLRKEAMTHPAKAPQTAHSFGCLETFIVVVILGFLAALVVPNVVGRTDQARYTAAEVQLMGLSNALKLYKLDNGVVPSTAQGLHALVQKPSLAPVPPNWRSGGYLDKSDLPIDPWGNPYQYTSPGQDNTDYEILSFGADGVPGGEGFNADLHSHRLVHR